MGEQIAWWTRWAWLCVLVGERFVVGVCVPQDGKTVFFTKGDAVITQLLPLHYGSRCDQLGMTEVQVLEATKLAVHRVNQLSLVPGIKLGPEDEASASAVGGATQSLGSPVMAYSARPSPASHTYDFLTPAPYRSVQAAVQVLSSAGVDAISIVHTADTEGHVLVEHIISAAEYAYICVEMVLEDGNTVGLTEVLREGPGTLVILGSRHRVQSLTRALGGPQGPVDLLLLIDSGGPVPQVELAGLETPAILLQRTVHRLPEFASFLERDLESDDGPRRQYMATLSKCGEVRMGYDAAANSAIAAVLVYAEALREAQATHCSTEESLCRSVTALETSEWNDLLASASLQEPATAAFPGLLDDSLEPGSEDVPRYTVNLLINGSITKVGQADESLAVLGRLEVREPRCGAHCPCSILVPPLMLPPAVNVTQSSGFDIMGGSKWWTWQVPSLENMTKREVAVYFTAFCFLIVIFVSSCVVCLINMIKAPRRQ
nr:uncharacterized protein LOC128685137 [Cherax quadricarinatus]